MILITGSAQAPPETLQEMLKISVEHVHRSRLEPGCIFHAVSQDAEDPLKLVFVEKWADQAANSGPLRTSAENGAVLSRVARRL